MLCGYWKTFLCIILILCVSSNGSPITLDNENKNGFLYESKMIMRSLGETLKYLAMRPESLTGDVVFGVFIANANLKWIYDRLKNYCTSHSWPEKELELYMMQCHRVTENSKTRNLALLNKNLWDDAAGNLKYGVLHQHDEFLLPEFNSCQSINKYMMKGTPKDSDFCINELLSSGCKVSEFCWLSEINGDSHSGYKTSHRLLYFLVASKMKCEKINPIKFSAIKTVKKKLCQQMLLEAMALFQKPSISITRDLFMEQIALCGLEGYEEFASYFWTEKVISWQNPSGCFGLGKDFRNCSLNKLHKNNSIIKIKRTDSVIDDCHTHVTAVAVSALAFFLRVNLKMAFNLP